MVGNTVTSAETLNIYGGGANIEGTVYAPKADVKIGTTLGNGINRGQLICNSLDIYGDGAVIWGHAGNTTPDVTPVPSEEPTPEPTEEPTPRLLHLAKKWIFKVLAMRIYSVMNLLFKE